jgi:hypothetical protein
MAEAVRLELVVVDKTGAALGKAKGNIEGLNKSLGNTRKLAKAAAGALVAIGTGILVRGLINTIRQFEDLRATLVTVEGSTSDAAKAFRLIKDFTQTTPFQLQDVTSAFITFRNAGLDPTAEFMTNIGNIAAGMGRRIDDVAKAVFNATTGEFEMLKQLGIKVKTEGDKLKVIFQGTTTEIRNNGIDIVNTIEEIGKTKFAGGIDRQAQTLTGAFSNLQDEVAIFADEIGEGGLTAALTEVTRAIIDASEGSENLANKIGQSLGNALLFVKDNADTMITAFKIFLALGLVIYIGKLASAFKALGLSVDTVKKAILLLNKAMRANPILFAVGVAIAGIIAFEDEIVELGQKFGILKKKTEDATGSHVEYQHELSETVEKSRRLTTAEKLAAAQKEKLESALGKYTEKLRDNITTLEANSIANEIDREIYIQKAKALKGLNEEQERELRGLLEKQKTLKDLQAAEKALPGIIKKVGGGVFKSPEVTAMEEEVAYLEILRNNKKISEEQYQQSIKKIREDAARAEANRRKKEQEDVIDLIKQGKAKEIDIEVAFGKDKKGLTIALGRELIDQLAQVNEKAFKISKALAIADAIIHTAQGVMRALSTGNFLMAALIAATGAVQVAKIKSTQYQGPREKGGPVAQNQNYLVGENGPEILKMGARGGTIIPNNQMGNQVTVNFNIETIDASGFDELLIDRRSTIVGVINEAMNRQGREGITA